MATNDPRFVGGVRLRKSGRYESAVTLLSEVTRVATADVDADAQLSVDLAPLYLEYGIALMCLGRERRAAAAVSAPLPPGAAPQSKRAKIQGPEPRAETAPATAALVTPGDVCRVCSKTTVDAAGEALADVLLCDDCDAEVHLRCAGIAALPGDDEPFSCGCRAAAGSADALAADGATAAGGVTADGDAAADGAASDDGDAAEDDDATLAWQLVDQARCAYEACGDRGDDFTRCCAVLGDLNSDGGHWGDAAVEYAHCLDACEAKAAGGTPGVDDDRRHVAALVGAARAYAEHALRAPGEDVVVHDAQGRGTIVVETAARCVQRARALVDDAERRINALLMRLAAAPLGQQPDADTKRQICAAALEAGEVKQRVIDAGNAARPR
ncbi:hypothetical protein M885DRAFT_610850 [Pelagophyceae sp. CCMP2097]|nr:hypothetical protein M885DRAFT_610850 [Pelagophyceae sp. CCMP2097]